MDKVLAGLPVTVTKNLDDGAGNLLPVQSISYRLLDADAVELIVPTDLAFEPGAASIEVEIPGAYNSVADGTPAVLRTVEFICAMTAGGILRLASSYVVRSLQPLAAGVNSFQTMAHAEMNALSMLKLTAWSDSDDERRADALIEAFHRIRTLRFFVVQMNDDQSRESFGLYSNGFQGSLEQMSADSILALPELFLKNLRLAQIAEADSILAGTDQDDDENLLLHSIGDTKKMFKQGMRVKTPITRAAMRYLGRYIDNSLRIRR